MSENSENPNKQHGTKSNAAMFEDFGSYGALVAYRLSILEVDLKGLEGKLDSFFDKYPTNEVLKLILEPLKEDIHELERWKQSREQDEKANRQQYKFIMIAAIASPVFSILLTAIMATVLTK